MLPLLAARSDLDCRLLIHESQRSLFADVPKGIDVVVVGFKDGFIRRLIWEQTVLPIQAWSWADVTFSPANFGPLLAPRLVVLLRNALEVASVEPRLSKKIYWLVLSLMTWLSLALAPRAMAVSAYALERLGFGFKRKISVVHHGIDADLFHPDKRPREDFLLAVGDLTVQKNFHTLIEALAELPDAELRIAGRRVDEDYAQRLESDIRRLGLDGRVKLLGHVDKDDLAHLYRYCRLFLFSSTVETFGHPLLEAMASGCPILCAKSTAMPEIMGDAGHYAEPESVADWVRALTILLANDSLRGDLAKRAIERAKRFSWKKTADETARILINAAAPRPGPSLAMGILWIWIVAVLALYLFQFREILTLLPKML
ncbi:MAG: glycosyltransferase family 1 protein [Rhodospirillales bacterium]|nr:MAG: glycosyltransferase family 1 protein [Rhodospirillales bacterium]